MKQAHEESSIRYASDTDPRIPALDPSAVVATMLRTDLGRQLTVLLLEPPHLSGHQSASCEELRLRLAAYPEVRVLHETPASGMSGTEIEAVFAAAMQNDADAVLVWAEQQALTMQTPEGACTPSWRWPRMALEAAKRVNLFDRCFVALIGDDIERQDARRLGYEDGFIATMPLDSLVRQLAREAIARAQARNRGSSPPCYL